ncbi:MAG TPA: carboxypeptidase-like regulatory domain-containing protein [Fimbriimonadaceae bacterium]|jgi:protocatechuate 3,4-dioxygenase beta subunit
MLSISALIVGALLSANSQAQQPIRGTLLDTSGHTVANGEVFAVSGGMADGDQYLSWGNKSKAARVDATGHFVAPISEAEEAGGLFVFYLDPKGVRKVAGKVPNTEDFKILPSEPLPITVIDDLGNPIQNATVSVLCEESNKNPLKRLTVTVSNRTERAPLYTAITDARGHCLLEGVDGLVSVFACSCPGYAPITGRLRYSLTVSELSLIPAGEIKGQLLGPDGKSLPNVTLAAGTDGLLTSKYTQGEDPSVELESDKPVVTDSEGRFAFSGLAPGLYRIQFPAYWENHSLFFKGTDYVPLARNQTKQITINAIRPVLIKGRAVAADNGKPLAKTMLVLWSTDTVGQQMVAFNQATTDAKGYFSMLSPPGKAKLTVETSDFDGSNKPETLLDVSPESNKPILVKGLKERAPNPVCTLKGVVVGANGLPERGATINLVNSDKNEVLAVQTVHSDNSGWFSCTYKFSDLVRASADLGSEGTNGWVTFSRNAVVKLKLRPKCVGKIEGVIYDLEKKPAVNKRVELDYSLPNVEFSFREGTTDEKGRFSFSGLVPGQYVVMSPGISGPDFQGTAVINGAETKHIVCNFDETLPAVVEGVVEDYSGKPIEDAVIQDTLMSETVVSDAAGHFTLHRRLALANAYLMIDYGSGSESFEYHKDGIYKLPKVQVQAGRSAKP